MVRRTYYLPAVVVERLDRAVVELRLAAYVDRAPTKAEVIAAAIVAGLENRSRLVDDLRAATTRFEPSARTSGWQRPIAVPSSLDELDGPVTGVLQLPLDVYASGGGTRERFDLSDSAMRSAMYQIVLTEGELRHVRQLVNAEELRRSWSEMWLPADVRASWETHFPELAAR